MKLSALTKDQCEIVRSWRNLNIESLRTSFLLTKEMQEEFYRNVVSNRSGIHRYWAIEDSACHFIGMGGLTYIEWENGAAEVSLIIDPDWRGLGIGDKAFALLLDQAFNSMRLNMVFGECYCVNENKKFWEKQVEKYNGYKTILEKKKFANGKFFDSLYFSITKDQYNAKE